DPRAVPRATPRRGALRPAGHREPEQPCPALDAQGRHHAPERPHPQMVPVLWTRRRLEPDLWLSWRDRGRLPAGAGSLAEPGPFATAHWLFPDQVVSLCPLFLRSRQLPG